MYRKMQAFLVSIIDVISFTEFSLSIFFELRGIIFLYGFIHFLV